MSQVRIVVVGIVSGLALACGGAVEVDEIPEALPEAVVAEPEAEHAPVWFVTWTTDGGSCRVDLNAWQATVTTVGTFGAIPGPCPEGSWQASIVRTPDTDQALLVVAGAGYDVAVGQPPRAIPPLPAPFELERLTRVGADVVATAVHRGESSTVTHEDGDETVWTVADQEVRYKSQGYEAGVELCGRFHLADGAWVTDKLEATGLPEGVSPPWCDHLETEGLPPLMPPSSGGHGTFLTPATALGAPDDRAWLDLEGTGFAGFGSEILEGQSYETPLAWTGTEPWTIVEGFSAEHDNVDLTVGDGWAIACRRDHAALIDLGAGAKPVWTGAACPVAWQ